MGSLKSSKTTPKSSHFNSGRTRTRPCIYCGAFFFDFEKLRRHEETEAERFREEREKIQRQRPAQAPSELRLRGAAGPVQPRSQQLLQVRQQQAPVSVAFYRIDRTVEEFGEDWEDDQIYPPFYHSRLLKTATYRHRQLSSQVNNNNNNNYDKLHQSPSVLASLASLSPVRPRPQLEQDFQSLGENSWITFEPTRMPKMPESKIVVKSQLEEYLHKLNEEEWVKFIKEQLEPSAPVEPEDPNRMDCRHCGLLFNEVHVRKFHEESHRVEREEKEELNCGYCGQVCSSLAHKKLHETAHQSLEQPGACAAPSQGASHDCRLCGRKFMLLAELGDHNKTVCTASQPAKPVVTPSRPRLADQEGWTEDDPTLPAGWKIRSRPRATQAGQLFFLFLSPDSKVFHSRKKVVEHMEKLGGYSQFDFDKVREGSKNPRRSVGVGKKQENVSEEEEEEKEPASTDKTKAKRKSEEEDWAPKKKAASKKTNSEDEEKENKTDVKPKCSKRSRTSFQKYF